MKTNDEIADDFEYMYSKMYAASAHATAAAIMTVGAMLVKYNTTAASTSVPDLDQTKAWMAAVLKEAEDNIRHA